MTDKEEYKNLHNVAPSMKEALDKVCDVLDEVKAKYGFHSQSESVAFFGTFMSHLGGVFCAYAEEMSNIPFDLAKRTLALQIKSLDEKDYNSGKK